MITRRSFLTACLATFAAPAIVRASSLMPLSVPRLILWGDGIHDDTAALQALINGSTNVLQMRDGMVTRGPNEISFGRGDFLLSSFDNHADSPIAISIFSYSKLGDEMISCQSIQVRKL